MFFRDVCLSRFPFKDFTFFSLYLRYMVLWEKPVQIKQFFTAILKSHLNTQKKGDSTLWGYSGSLHKPVYHRKSSMRIYDLEGGGQWYSGLIMPPWEVPILVGEGYSGLFRSKVSKAIVQKTPILGFLTTFSQKLSQTLHQRLKEIRWTKERIPVRCITPACQMYMLPVTTRCQNW